MSSICQNCGKRPMAGNNVSHSHRKTKRRWLPNIQPITLYMYGEKRRIKICTRCLRTFNHKGILP